MADVTKEQVVDFIANMTVLELSRVRQRAGRRSSGFPRLLRWPQWLPCREFPQVERKRHKPKTRRPNST